MKPYYQDNIATIFHGDAAELMPTISSGLVVTDPPYNIGYHYHSYHDKLPEESYQQMLKMALRLPCVVIHYCEDLFDISDTIGVSPEKIVAWVYPSNTARQWRGIAWFGIKPDFTRDGQDYKNPKDSRIAKRIAEGKRARLYDWWEINQVKNIGKEKTEHPCQIPTEVMSRIIKISNYPQVIDPFLGSGTSLVAAKNLGIPSIGIEADERYCEIAAKRISECLTLIP